MRTKLLIFSISVALSALLLVNETGLRWFFLSSFVGFIVFGLGTAWSIIKNKSIIKPWYVVLIVGVGVLLPHLIFWFMNFSSTLILAPKIIVLWLGIFAGYLFVTLTNKPQRISLVVIALLVGSWSSLPGYLMYIRYVNYLTINGKVKEYITIPVVFKDQDNVDVDLASFKGNFVVLYLWDTYDKTCTKELPELQKLYNKFKDRDGILFYPVHCIDFYKSQTSKTGYNILKREGFSFRCLNIIKGGYLCGEIGINTFPITLIIDKESHVIYRGNLESSVKILNNLEAF